MSLTNTVMLGRHSKKKFAAIWLSNFLLEWAEKKNSWLFNISTAWAVADCFQNNKNLCMYFWCLRSCSVLLLIQVLFSLFYIFSYWCWLLIEMCTFHIFIIIILFPAIIKAIKADKREAFFCCKIITITVNIAGTFYGPWIEMFALWREPF